MKLHVIKPHKATMYFCVCFFWDEQTVDLQDTFTETITPSWTLLLGKLYISFIIIFTNCSAMKQKKVKASQCIVSNTKTHFTNTPLY